MKHLNCDVFTVKDSESGQWISCIQLKADNHYATAKQVSKRVINFPHRALFKALTKLEKEYFIERIRGIRTSCKVVCADIWRRGIDKVLNHLTNKLQRIQFQRAFQRNVLRGKR